RRTHGAKRKTGSMINYQAATTLKNTGGGENSATWGLGSGHDPCDWMQPTRHWQTGKIYYDRFGLRPPALEKIHAPFLQLEIRVTGRSPNTKCYLHPKPLSVRLSN
ncbi:hypothetical protein, partial [Celeribacter sp.]|uniref:hypothetical protein n=1 Tax=Celeribacter sp. TaxID=1890673 RepID=UPI003A906162